MDWFKKKQKEEEHSEELEDRCPNFFEHALRWVEWERENRAEQDRWTIIESNDIITSYTPSDLFDILKVKKNEGWVLSGTPFSCGGKYAQAIIKHDRVLKETINNDNI